ncbi:MAG: sugar transferase [Alphaproteobacteria bacterium]
MPHSALKHKEIADTQLKYFVVPANDLVVLPSFSRKIKRAMDIVIAVVALVILCPVFVLIALMLKIEGQGGSVFYGGARVGKYARPFNCWKFRSMQPDADHLLDDYLNANPMLKRHWEKFCKLPNDPRVTTHTARIIRKLSLDELPQLWNVLVGDMSLVGPRPMLVEEMQYCGSRIAYYLSVRPGLTGLWQVSGRNNTSFKHRVHLDSWYVRNWSLWQDVLIMLKTPFAVLNTKGAY